MATANLPYTESGIIRTLRGRGIRATDISDQDLLVIIEDALNEYLFYRPKVTITSLSTCITTVVDQPNYDKPTGALWIKEVCWNPGYTDSAYDDLWDEMMLRNLTDGDTGIMLFDYQKAGRLHKYYQGQWEIRNDQIWLMPVPGTVTKVAVIYADSRTLEELDEIADRRFLELCYYLSLSSIGTSKLTGGGFKAGQYSVSESVGRETMRAAEKGLERTRHLLSLSYQGRRS